MQNTKSKLDWCIKKELIKEISPSDKISKEHIEKAKHNLRAADYCLKGKFDDWVVSQCYYAMYHSLLAILFKRGYESRNHECTINAVDFLIETKEIIFNKEDISYIRTAEQMTSKDAKSLREEFQYGTETKVNEILLDDMLKKSKEIVEKVELLLNEMDEVKKQQSNSTKNQGG